jgi:uncharacterized protein (DUF305 family)
LKESIMRTRSVTRFPGAAALTLLLGLTLAGCGDDADSEPGSGHAASDTQTAANGDVFNDADVQFATDMIPHHAQAVQMVVLAQGRPLDPEVEGLANEIRDAQVPEIEAMTDWLTAWDHEVPETSLDHANAGHDMDDMSGTGDEQQSDMPGMMSQEDMDGLADATDAEFQDLWLNMMIEHHAGAIEMAQAEQEDGEFAAAVALAETIEAGQQAEIATMEDLLG